MATRVSADDAVIEGLGMVASLGFDVDTICAAARAGLLRSRPLENYRIRSAVGGDEEPVIAHEAGLLTLGFEGAARQIRLAQGALSDLLRHTPQVDWAGQRHRFYVALADPARLDLGALLIADEAERGALAERQSARAAEIESEMPFPQSAELILRRAAQLARWPAQIEMAFSSCAGNLAALQAIEAASADLSSGTTDIAVVIGVDSLLDEAILNWLNVCGRLKCDGAPAGLRPGEAAVALALRPALGVSASSGSAQIQGIAFSDDARSLYSGSAPAGEGLAEAIDGLWRSARYTMPWLICDQNGENYRAADWGFAAVRLRAQHESFASPILWYPAASIGDTATASALAGICFAALAWKRGYAPAEGALITACNDDGGRGAIFLKAINSALGVNT
jgi:3-oxoacyl-[acyl-carrier-protein] synthase-1